MSSPIVILGSSRGDGHTMAAVRSVLGGREVPIVDLNDKNISYYDYTSKNLDDDFINLVETMLEHDSIILATPVYWYTMSAVMKTFIDRWSDLLSKRKDLGRRLKGKKLYVITSYGTTLPKGFEEPFQQACEYMGVEYKGCYYYNSVAESIQNDVSNFHQSIFHDHLEIKKD